MKTYIRFCLALILTVLLIASAALADSTCTFTFTALGKTYQGYHEIRGNSSSYRVPNRVMDTSPSFDWITSEYAIYSAAERAAIEKHAAVCPYTHNLGDERVPMALIYGGAALAVIAILVVHKKRKSLRAVN